MDPASLQLFPGFSHISQPERISSTDQSRTIELFNLVIAFSNFITHEPDGVKVEMSSNTRMGFRYLPLYSYDQTDSQLHPERESIRLLEITPGDDSIHCRVQHARLAESPAYIALSYVWGDSRNSHNILVEQTSPLPPDTPSMMSLEVTSNLHGALKHLRNRYAISAASKTLFWIDAICINQKDGKEKARQVNIMRYIYSQAQQTIVWLDPDKKGSQLDVAFLRKLLEVRAAQCGKQPRDTRNIFQMPVRLKKTQVWTKEYDLPLPPDQRYTNIFTLLDRPWFSRIWIIQEAAVSKNSVVHCGANQIPLIDFLEAVHYCTNDLGVGAVYKAASNFKVTKLYNAWYTQQAEHRRQYLLELLQQHRDFLASDPRDKVFALLGLAENTQHGPQTIDIEVHYTPVLDQSDVNTAAQKTLNLDNVNEDATQRYINLASEFITKGNSLDVLSYVKAPKQAHPQLPSWVPDWRILDVSITFRDRDEEGQYVFPFAAAPPAQDRDICITRSHQLELHGRTIDSIAKIGPVWDISGEDLTKVRGEFPRVLHRQRVLYRWYRLCEANSAGKTYYNRDVDVHEPTLSAFWQSLIAGGTYGGVTLEERHFTDYFSNWKLFNWVFALRFDRIPVFGHIAFLLVFAIITLKAFSGRNQLDLTFQKRMGTTSSNRKMFKSEKNLIGLAPPNAEEGDILVVCKGAMVPLVIRKEAKGCLLIGDAYVHGIMMGSAFRSFEDEELEDFILV